MAGNAGAIEAGFEYQWLYGWYRLLHLLDPEGPLSIAIEDATAVHFDDVTIRPRPDSGAPAEFLQVKFHVGTNGHYSAAGLVEHQLVEKAWRTFQALRQEHDALELSLVTTWEWHDDPVRIEDKRLTRAFIKGDVTGKARSERDAWYEHVGSPPPEEFEAFLSALRFRTSFDGKTDLIERVVDRLRANGLRTDQDAIESGIQQVREWVMDRNRERMPLTRSDVEAAIEKRRLRAGPPEPPSVTLWVHTVKRLPAEDARYELDWRDAFEGPARERGHQLLDPSEWNGRLLPDLEAMADRIESETTARLLRVRGFARLSPWFAVGYTFRESSGWTIETSQYDAYWRTNEPASDDAISVLPTEDLPGDSAVVAVSIGVTRDPTPDVRQYLEATGQPAGRLVVIGTPRTGNEAIRGGGDLVQLAGVVKETLQGLRPKAKTILLFYLGPASGAVFIGHRLNAVASSTHLHEMRDGVYIPSFVLG